MECTNSNTDSSVKSLSFCLEDCCKKKDNIISLSNKEPDPACQADITSSSSSTQSSTQSVLLNIDVPHINNILTSCHVDDNYFAQTELFEKSFQSRRQFGTNTNNLNAWSLTEEEPVFVFRPPSNPCSAQIYSIPKNPLGILMRKPFRLKKSVGAKVAQWTNVYCDGATITGDNSMANNGSQVIMKNRVPPGGFSAGLW